MPGSLIADAAGPVTLTLATEVPVVVATPAAPGQVNTLGNGVLITATVDITGAVSATTCTLKLRRGNGITGTDILASDPVVSVDAAATDRAFVVTAIETDANFNATAGIYTLTANAAGAAQTARRAMITAQGLSGGV